MLTDYKLGQGSIVLRVKLRSSASASGGGLTGLTSASAGLIVATIADNEAATTRYRASSSEIETITTLGTYAAPTSGKCRFKEVDATNHPGIYEIQIADARFSVSSAKSMIISISGATSLIETDALIPLRSVDPYDATAFGVSRIDAAISSRGTGAALDAAGVRSAVGLASANLDTQLAALFTTAMTESYAADGSAPTPAQALFLIQQRLTEFAISGTTITVKKLDGSTTAATLTLDDATAPTSSTRAS